jgi:hypothetical protein
MAKNLEYIKRRLNSDNNLVIPFSSGLLFLSPISLYKYAGLNVGKKKLSL